MADNTVLNTGTGGDSIRDIDRAGVKTQVAQIDIGGASAEKLVVAGQQTMANSLPVTLASDTGRIGSVQITGGATSQALGLGAGATAYGYLRVTTEPSALFGDVFDGTVIDTTNRWNTPVAVGGMTITQATGGLNINSTTTLSDSVFIDSQPLFSNIGLSFLAFGCAVKVEAQSANLFALNQHRFFGLADRPTTFAAATPLKNAIGFEIGIDGQIYCVVYSNGVNKFRSSVSLTGVNLNTLCPNAGGYVRLGMGIRADTIIFNINSSEYPAQTYSVANSGFALPDVQALPVRIHAVNNTTGTVGATISAISAFGMADTGSNSNQINDGTYQWRKATIKPATIAAATSDTSLVVSISPNSPLPAGTNSIGTAAVKGAALVGTSASIAAAGTGTIGPVDVSSAGNATFTVKNTVAASAYAGAPVLVFEQSDDNVSWGPLGVVRSDTGALATTFTLAANTANGSLMFDAGMEGVNFVRCRVTTGPTTNALTVVITGGGMPFSPSVSVTNQPITKAVQGTTGVTTQDLKDSGRVNVAITAYQAAGIITTEALFAAATFSSSRDGAAASTGQQFTVTAGKRLRIQSIECGIKNNAAAAGTSKLVLRYAGAGGTITNASPILAIWDLGSNSVTAAQYIGPMVLPIPDGMELIPNSTFGFTNLSSAATMLHTISINGYEY